MDTSLLRRLRFFECVIMNIPLLTVWFLLIAMPMYLELSQRLTFSFVLMLLSCSIIFRQRLGNLFYLRIFPFMKPLWEYEQQKFVSDKRTKWRHNRRYVNAFNASLIIILWIVIMIYPPPLPRQVNWYLIIGNIVGMNIGMVLRALTEEFYY